LLAIDIMIIIAAIFVMLESFSTFLREKRKTGEPTGT
jgi:hypothetical protein